MAENHDRTAAQNSSIVENLARVSEQIADACHCYRRDVSHVRLIAVSKTKPVEAVRTALEAGQMDFGENQVQDALGKIPCLENENLNWHFIGPLQSNKAKHIPGNFDWWHTLNRPDIAKRVSAKAIEANKTVNTLIQVNVVNDSAKSGVLPDELPALIDRKSVV